MHVTVINFIIITLNHATVVTQCVST